MDTKVEEEEEEEEEEQEEEEEEEEEVEEEVTTRIHQSTWTENRLHDTLAGLCTYMYVYVYVYVCLFVRCARIGVALNDRLDSSL